MENPEEEPIKINTRKDTIKNKNFVEYNLDLLERTEFVNDIS
jgi:hypothetical protein